MIGSKIKLHEITNYTFKELFFLYQQIQKLEIDRIRQMFSIFPYAVSSGVWGKKHDIEKFISAIQPIEPIVDDNILENKFKDF